MQTWFFFSHTVKRHYVAETEPNSNSKKNLTCIDNQQDNSCTDKQLLPEVMINDIYVFINILRHLQLCTALHSTRDHLSFAWHPWFDAIGLTGAPKLPERARIGRSTETSEGQTTKQLSDGSRKNDAVWRDANVDTI